MGRTHSALKNILLILLGIAAMTIGPRPAFPQGASCGLSGICSGPVTADSDAVVLPIAPTTGTVYVVVSGTWTGTLSFMQSGDGGAHYVTATATDGTTTSTTASGQWRFPGAGLTNFEVIATSAITGTANVRINQSSASAGAGGGGSGGGISGSGTAGTFMGWAGSTSAETIPGSEFDSNGSLYFQPQGGSTLNGTPCYADSGPTGVCIGFTPGQNNQILDIEDQAQNFLISIWDPSLNGGDVFVETGSIWIAPSGAAGVTASPMMRITGDAAGDDALDIFNYGKTDNGALLAVSIPTVQSPAVGGAIVARSLDNGGTESFAIGVQAVSIASGSNVTGDRVYSIQAQTLDTSTGGTAAEEAAFYAVTPSYAGANPPTLSAAFDAEDGYPYSLYDHGSGMVHAGSVAVGSLPATAQANDLIWCTGAATIAACSGSGSHNILMVYTGSAWATTPVAF